MRSAHDLVAATARATARDRLLIAGHRGEAMADPPDQLGAIVDVARILSDGGVAYALIGGIAVGIRAEVPRATQDIDIAIPSGVSREAVVSALTGAGFELVGDHAHSVNLRHPLGERVQLAVDPAFDDMIERAERVEVAGIAVYVVTKDDLIAMKERSAVDPARRPSKALRDRADLEMLKGDVPGPDEGW